MKALTVTSFIQVIGRLWMPNTEAAISIALSDSDIEDLKDDDGNITRESIDLWLSTHTGDFRSLKDFRADIETGTGNLIIEWENEESQFIYDDCMF